MYGALGVPGTTDNTICPAELILQIIIMSELSVMMMRDVQKT
jgi:hypothetical protein